MDLLYPKFENTFTELLTGKCLKYSPEEIAKEFIKYIDDLAQHPICVEVEYKKLQKSTSSGGGENEQKQGQTRVEKYPASPTISDFCSRWLGKSMRWWSELDKTKDADKRERYIRVKNLVSVYCRKVKLNGAEVGIYNYNIIARELGLVDKQQVEQTGKSIQYIVQSDTDVEELKKAVDGVGLVE